jgi:hypothetical protein
MITGLYKNMNKNLHIIHDLNSTLTVHTITLLRLKAKKVNGHASNYSNGVTIRRVRHS